jgi:hypothetical protein
MRKRIQRDFRDRISETEYEGRTLELYWRLMYGISVREQSRKK